MARITRCQFSAFYFKDNIADTQFWDILQNLGLSMLHHLSSLYNFVVLKYCFFVKLEDITSESPGESMSLFCRRKEYLQVSCDQLLIPSLIWKSVICDYINMVFSFLELTLFPTYIKTAYFCLFERDGFERACSPILANKSSCLWALVFHCLSLLVH